MGWILRVGAAISTIGTVVTIVFRITESTSCLCSMLLYQPIVFTLQAAQGFEEEYKGDNTDAGTREQSSGDDVPCRRKEACVKGIQVPEHL